jgi:osmotically-inducible protein OsmY
MGRTAERIKSELRGDIKTKNYDLHVIEEHKGFFKKRSIINLKGEVDSQEIKDRVQEIAEKTMGENTEIKNKIEVS